MRKTLLTPDRWMKTASSIRLLSFAAERQAESDSKYSCMLKCSMPGWQRSFLRFVARYDAYLIRTRDTLSQVDIGNDQHVAGRESAQRLNGIRRRSSQLHGNAPGLLSGLDS